MQTHSVASVNADVLTSKGWTTFSSRMSVIVPCVGIKPVSQAIRSTRGGTYPANVDPSAAVPVRVAVSQFGHRQECVQAGVLCQGVRHNLQRLRYHREHFDTAEQSGSDRRTSAYALIHSLSMPEMVFAYCASFCDTSASGAAPPAIICLHTTHD